MYGLATKLVRNIKEGGFLINKSASKLMRSLRRGFLKVISQPPKTVEKLLERICVAKSFYGFMMNM